MSINSNNQEESGSSNVVEEPTSSKKSLKEQRYRHTYVRKPSEGGTNLRIWEKEAFMDSFEEHCEGKWLGHGPPEKKLCEKISKDVTALSTDVVGKYIERNLRAISKARNRSDKPIDKWFEVVDAVSPNEDDLEKQLGLVMMVAREEPSDGVPKPANFDSSMPQPDYESIYEYLSCAYKNKPLPILSPIDSLVIEDCMQSLTYQIECLNDEELRKSLRKVFLHMSQKVGDELEAEDEDMKKNIRHNATLFNPLGLNAQAIVPVVPD